MEMIMAKSRRGPLLSLVATRKGVFILHADPTQRRFRLEDGGQTWTEAAEPPRFSKAEGDEIRIVGALSGGH
jgi:hypothetical protein